MGCIKPIYPIQYHNMNVKGETIPHKGKAPDHRRWTRGFNKWGTLSIPEVNVSGYQPHLSNTIPHGECQEEINKECQSNIRSVHCIITPTVGILIIRKFALLSERIGPVSGNTGSERKTTGSGLETWQTAATGIILKPSSTLSKQFQRNAYGPPAANHLPWGVLSRHLSWQRKKGCV